MNELKLPLMLLGVIIMIALSPFFAVWKLLQFALTRSRTHIERKQKEARQIQKQRVRDAEVIGTPCGTCSKTITAGYLTDDFKPWVHYCSGECYLAANKKDKEEIERKRNSKPVEIPISDAILLVGKSSGGMCFESGRCAKCGQALGNHDTFGFCSESCENKAYAPYRACKDDLANDPRFKLASDGMVELSTEGFSEHQNITRENKEMAPEDFREKIKTQQYFAKIHHDHRLQEDIIQARNAFMTNWEKQREYILARERPKEQERQRKEQEKDAAQQANEIEQLLENQRWEPRRFEL